MTSAMLDPRHLTPARIAWAGGLFIAAILVLAAYDIVRGYHDAIDNASRELHSQSRVTAEQTARTIQAVDVVLRHLADQFNKGVLPALSAADLRAYLKEQAIGLVQIDGLLVVNSDGTVRASSYIEPEREATVRLAAHPLLQSRADRPAGLLIGDTMRSTVDGRWILPMLRRLDSSSGEFVGAVAARGRIDYF